MNENETLGSVTPIAEADKQTAPTPPENTVLNQPTMQNEQPVGNAIVETPHKKKKVGLIVGIVVAAVILIGGGIIAALAILNSNKNDPVAMAMAKIMRNETPSNVAIDGDINISVNDPDSLISNIKISLKSGLATSPLTNKSEAIVTATLRNIGDVTVEVSEIYAVGGDLFFKIEGAASAIEDSGLLYLLYLANQMPNVIDCGEDEYCQSSEIVESYCESNAGCSASDIMTLEDGILTDGGQAVLDENTISFFKTIIDEIEIIDGEWLRISADDLGLVSSSNLEQSNASCIVDLVSNINADSSSAIELYNQHPFIRSTDKGVTLKSKQYPVYKIDVSGADFAGFVSSIQNSMLVESIYTCLDLDNNVQISADDAERIVQVLPEFYAEVDDEYNFTRLYLVSEIDSDDMVVTMDLNFSYPTNINVSEPLEYQDFSKIIQDISTSLFEIETGSGVDN